MRTRVSGSTSATKLLSSSVSVVLVLSESSGVKFFNNWPSGTNFYGNVIHVIWSHMATDIFDQSQCIFMKLKGLLFYM